MSLEILQIVPNLPPAVNGVGDYAYLLAKRLRAAHDIHSHFLVCDSSQNSEGELEGFKIHQLEAQRQDKLAGRLSAKEMPPVVLLHYVGYGYEKRGCPLWLLRGLESWRMAGADRRLAIMFHELYAFGPPWRSSFWSSPVHRWLSASLAKLADGCITNLERYAKWLEARAGRRVKIDALPVFSNIGEMTNTLPLDSRPPNLVIFGGARWVTELLGRYRSETLECCQHLGIREIFTIGCPAGTVPAKTPIPVTECGFLDAAEVVEIISSSRVGLMNYFPGYLAKSGVFAAYSSLRALPLLPRFESPDCDGCGSGKNFLFLDQLPAQMNGDTLQRVADGAWEWYQTHNLARTAEVYARLLKGCAFTC